VFSLYLASTGHVDIFTAKADGTDLRQLTNTPQGEEFADWGTRSEEGGRELATGATLLRCGQWILSQMVGSRAGAVATFAVAYSWMQITEKQVWQPLLSLTLFFVLLFLRGQVCGDYSS
jgi:hypothetical protein